MTVNQERKEKKAKVNSKCVAAEEKNDKKDIKEQSLALVKIAIASVSFNSQVLNLGVKIPGFLSGVMQSTSGVFGALLNFSSLSCLLLRGSSAEARTSVFSAKATLWLLLPVALILLQAFALAVFYLVQKRRHGRDKSTSLKATVVHWFIVCSAVTFFTLSNSLATMAFQIFNCVQVDADGKEFALASDLSFKCHTSQHTALKITHGVPMLVRTSVEEKRMHIFIIIELMRLRFWACQKIFFLVMSGSLCFRPAHASRMAYFHTNQKFSTAPPPLSD